MFNLEIRTTDKTRRVANNVGRALVKKKKNLYLVQKRLTQLTILIFMTRKRTFT